MQLVVVSLESLILEQQPSPFLHDVGSLKANFLIKSVIF